MDTAALYSLFLKSTGVSTDTRTLEKGALFFALSGPHFDGNQFAQKALEKGALAVVVDDAQLERDTKQIWYVDNTLSALQKLATYHRQQLNTTLIALTGSNGKTTTKELIATVLKQKYKLLATAGNLNNHIGVPLTLLKLKPEHEIGIIEMGANALGEIAALAAIAQPNWGVITNFGKAHLEGFGSEEGVIQGKTELYRHLIQFQQKILINADDPNQIKYSLGGDVVTFGQTKEAELKWYPSKSNTEGIRIVFEGHSYHSKLYGSYNCTNLAIALAFGTLFDITPAKAQQALQNYESTNNRSQIIHIKETAFVLDAYNANPSSMQAALEAFAAKKNSKKAVILGDMRELGTHAVDAHEQIAALTTTLGIEKVLLIGPLFSATSFKHNSIE
ncbi:MAG: UDP-N-acetylmuramoyl-tripeptide--D-alanyl-D-alanine ligase, partial [Flavobacteriaceae bacterium]